MEETGFSEKMKLMREKQYRRSYGTISAANTKLANNSSTVYIRHDLQPDDTLQGIALKYGVTMEQIRRVNRLLMTDSIFIRQSLLIPVEAESLDTGATAVNNNIHTKAARSHSLDIQPEPSTSSSASITSSMTSSRSIEPIEDEDSRRDMDDFLSKVDSSIALTKKCVEKTRKQSDFLADNHDYDISCNGSSSSLSTSDNKYEQKITYEGAYQSLNRVSSNPDQRHIRNSLNRLQKQQEELFEL